MEINHFGAIQKVRQNDGTTAIVFPINRASDVYVDLENRITLADTLSALTAGDTVRSREGLVHDLTMILSNLSEIIKKPLRLNTFQVLDATDGTQISHTATAGLRTYATKEVINMGIVAPSKILITDDKTITVGEQVTLKVFVTVNGYDQVVNWEDATAAYQNGEYYEFHSTVKEAGKDYGIQVRYLYTLTNSSVDKVEMRTVTLSFM